MIVNMGGSKTKDHDILLVNKQKYYNKNKNSTFTKHQTIIRVTLGCFAKQAVIFFPSIRGLTDAVT
jgi:hypothetical protein